MAKLEEAVLCGSRAEQSRTVCGVWLTSGPDLKQEVDSVRGQKQTNKKILKLKTTVEFGI